MLAKTLGQTIARHGVLATFALETHIGDDAEDIVAVGFVDFDGLLVRSGQHHLGATAHTHGLEVVVEGFLRELLALLEHKTIEVGQSRGVEADAVLNEENYLHSDRSTVLRRVPFVLNQLDDSHQQLGIAQPGEHVVYARQVLALHAAANFAGEGRQDYNGNRGMEVLDIAGGGKDIGARHIGHDDDELEIATGQLHEGFFLGGHAGEPRRISQAERCIFIEDEFVNAAIVFKHEGIVFGGNE